MAPVGRHALDGLVTTMKKMKYSKTRKCNERACWMLNRLLITVRRIDSAGDIPRPVITAAGAAMKTVVKYAAAAARCS
jgi:hypothetical protein